MNTEQRIRLDEKGICIDGTYRTLLASSLFYFRIPRERWEARMLLLKAAGYQAIDVYFPWNFHETAPDEWDFTGQRDISAFLELAGRHGLFVIARPGPYICSEWDGGALPAWLAAERVAVRQDEPRFLSYIENWYAHILPLLAPWQITGGGAVICMQIENELDFFDCKSPVSYMEKLMKMARSYGIEVPLFYCCGQNDLLRGGGLTPGLYTAFNVYTDAGNPGLEERAGHLYRAASDRRMPFLVTETNREHSYLKRLIACGAKLVSPYNQTAGSTRGWYNGITNWGKDECPIALMASDYDFDSMIGSAGEVNEQFYEARLLAGLLYSLGEAFASAVSVTASGMTLTSAGPVNERPALLKSKRGGLLAVSNLGEAAEMELRTPANTYSLHMPAMYTKLLPVNLALSEDGGAVLIGSNYEIAYIIQNTGRTDGPQENGITVGMYGEGELTADLAVGEEITGIAFTPKERPTAYTVGNVTLIAGSAEAMALGDIPGLPSVRADFPAAKPVQAAQYTAVSIQTVQAQPYLPPCAREMSEPVHAMGRLAQPMEKMGQYRGVGRYSFRLEQESPVLFQEAADILTLYRNGQKLKTCYGRGNCLEMQLKEGNYELYTEIWGHSNFNDIRCRSLHMDSLKGVSGIHTIAVSRDISRNWMFDLDEQPLSEWYFFRHSNFNTISAVDGYNRASMPLRAVYDKWVELPERADSLFLYFSKADCVISVYINGHYEGDVLPDDPYLDISAYAGNGRIEICLRILRRFYADEAGRVLLLAGSSVKNCSYASIPVEETVFAQGGSMLSLPASFTPNQDMLLSLKLPAAPSKDSRDIKLFFEGRDVKLTVLHHHTVIGRLLLESGGYPTVAGGSRNVVHLCREWAEREDTLIWCQPMGPQPCISSLEARYYRPIVDGQTSS